MIWCNFDFKNVHHQWDEFNECKCCGRKTKRNSEIKEIVRGRRRERESEQK